MTTEAEFLDEIQTNVLRAFLLAIHSHLTSTALSWDIYFFKLTLPFTIQILYEYTVKERRNHDRNPYKNFKSENSQDYAQKPQRNCMFMNSSSGKEKSYYYT